ncbi:MAG: hypothetical protein HMLIMOIP_000938 [Candidatus Nitrosomirales archaeon]|jgi:hypothetical protein
MSIYSIDDSNMVQRQVSTKEFEKLTAEIHRAVGNKFKDHKDGDCEKLLFKAK